MLFAQASKKSLERLPDRVLTTVHVHDQACGGLRIRLTTLAPRATSRRVSAIAIFPCPPTIATCIGSSVSPAAWGEYAYDESCRR
jgi:hypothetical protein